MTNVMIDLETLGVGSDAIILSVAAVEFIPETGVTRNGFYSKVDIDSYKPYTGCFTLDGETLTWWMTGASEEARREAFLGERKSIKSVLDELIVWLKARAQPVKPWSHGSSFDISILTHSFRILGLEIPWSFWNIRDTRTIYDLAGVDLKTVPSTEEAREYPLHHPIGDCFRQIEALRVSYGIMQKRTKPEPVTDSLKNATIEDPDRKRLQKKTKR